MVDMRVLVAQHERWLANSASIDEITQQLNQRGLVCLYDVVSTEWIDSARANVRSRLTEVGLRNHFVIGPGDEPNTPANAFVTDPQIVALLHGLSRIRRPRRAVANERIHTALSILGGSSAESGPSRFHYDASTVTMVVPVLIPHAGQGRSGELVVFPNRRPFRRYVTANIVEKAIAQTTFYRSHAMKRIRREPGIHVVDMEPGNVYLFWGYRTYHGTLACVSEAVRVALLLHCGSPHGSSWTLTTAKSLSRALPRSTQTVFATLTPQRSAGARRTVVARQPNFGDDA